MDRKKQRETVRGTERRRERGDKGRCRESQKEIGIKRDRKRHGEGEKERKRERQSNRQREK